MATTTSFLGLKKPAYTDAADVQVLNDNLDIIEKAIGARSRVFNLLIDSDFTNPVNQRGATAYSGVKYMIDGWKGSPCELAVNDGSITVSKGSADYGLLAQFTPQLTEGKTYTLAAQNAAGEIAILVFSPKVDMSSKEKSFSTAGHTIVARYSATSEMFYVGAANTGDTPLDLVWMALYEGSYTLDTLPDYVPKENELAKCKEYAVKTKGHGWGYTVNSTTLRLNIPVPTTLRVTPSIPSDLSFTVIANSTTYTVTDYSVNAMDNGVVRLTLTGSGFPTGRVPIVGYANKDFVFSSDW